MEKVIPVMALQKWHQLKIEANREKPAGSGATGFGMENHRKYILIREELIKSGVPYNAAENIAWEKAYGGKK